MVWVGTEANHRSHTAKPRARPDITGRASGVKAAMMEESWAPGQGGSVLGWPAFASAKALVKFLTNPWLLASGGTGTAPAGSMPKSCWFVFLNPSPGLHKGYQYAFVV